MKLTFQLFISFIKIGAFTFGGGYAMLPMLQKELVEKHEWVTDEELMDYFAIGQCTPGVIAVNTATFVGFKLKKIGGAFAATLGVILPSIVIITLLTALVSNFSELPIVLHALSGVRVCVCVLILNAVLKLGKKSLADALSWVLFAVVLLLSLFDLVPTVWLVVGAGIFGYLLYLFRRKNTTKPRDINAATGDEETGGDVK